MIIVVKKSNLLMLALIFLLAVALLSLNWRGGESTPVSVDAGQKTVMLDPGHGGEDPGAVSAGGLKEKDVNLAIALKARELLEAEGYKIIMTREEDRLEYSPGTPGYTEKRKQDLNRRKKMMDEAGADIVVSIHLNKFPQTQYSGAQVFFPPESPESMKLAQSLQKAIREQVDPANTREALVKKKEPQIIILKNVKTTTAIVECGFLSNEEEERKLAAPEYQGKLAAAIKQGVNVYFGKE